MGLHYDYLQNMHFKKKRIVRKWIHETRNVSGGQNPFPFTEQNLRFLKDDKHTKLWTSLSRLIHVLGVKKYIYVDVHFI